MGAALIACASTSRCGAIQLLRTEPNAPALASPAFSYRRFPAKISCKAIPFACTKASPERKPNMRPYTPSVVAVGGGGGVGGRAVEPAAAPAPPPLAPANTRTISKHAVVTRSFLSEPVPMAAQNAFAASEPSERRCSAFVAIAQPSNVGPTATFASSVRPKAERISATCTFFEENHLSPPHLNRLRRPA